MSNDEKLSELQNIEHRLQHYLSQKQTIQSQAVELDSALSELSEKTDSYRIIGNIMVKADAAALRKDLSEKREVLALRIRTIESHEDKLKAKAAELQKAITGE